jgi:hypothetical protein
MEYLQGFLNIYYTWSLKWREGYILRNINISSEIVIYPPFQVEAVARDIGGGEGGDLVKYG